MKPLLPVLLVLAMGALGVVMMVRSSSSGQAELPPPGPKGDPELPKPRNAPTPPRKSASKLSRPRKTQRVASVSPSRARGQRRANKLPARITPGIYVNQKTGVALVVRRVG